MFQRPPPVRDREPLQLEGRRRPADRPLPAADAQSPRRSATSRRRSSTTSSRRSSPPTRTRTSSCDGDLNDFEFSETVSILKAGVLHDLIDTLPQTERYSYVFEGNSQTLDHILVDGRLFARPFALRRRPRQRRVRRPGLRPRSRRSSGSTLDDAADGVRRRAVHGSPASRSVSAHRQRPRGRSRSPTRGISTTTAASRRPARAPRTPRRRRTRRGQHTIAVQATDSGGLTGRRHGGRERRRHLRQPLRADEEPASRRSRSRTSSARSWRRRRRPRPRARPRTTTTS